MTLKIVEDIRKKSRAEWQEFFSARIERFRTFAQENGEKVFLLGLVAGVLFILFFKVFLFLTVVTGVGILTIFVIADSNQNKPREEVEPPKNTGENSQS